MYVMSNDSAAAKLLSAKPATWPLVETLFDSLKIDPGLSPVAQAKLARKAAASPKPSTRLRLKPAAEAKPQQKQESGKEAKAFGSDGPCEPAVSEAAKLQAQQGDSGVEFLCVLTNRVQTLSESAFE